MTVIVELDVTIMQFNDCYFRINEKTDCFEIYHIEDMRCYTTIVAMFPKESVIDIYYKEKKE
jgi:hypothetical protein